VDTKLACAIGLVAAACGGGPVATIATQVAPVQAAPVAVTAQVSALPPGVSTEDLTCDAASSDACDGRDDDCDGRIDEGCGWESGPIQITLAWDSGADLDLYVTEPSGFTISYLDRSSPSGGVLDHDARGACIPGGEAIENVHWTSDRPPSGEYRVDVHYWGDCGVAGSTPARLSVSVGGNVIGVYDLILELGQRRATVAFTI
jgi:hypothetical protein